MESQQYDSKEWITVRFVKKVPEGYEFSGWLLERSIGFITFRWSGHNMVLPITKEMMKAFSLKRKGTELIFPTRRAEIHFERAIRDMFDAQYLQIRDVLAAHATEDMLTSFHDKVDEMLEGRLFSAAKQTIDVRKGLPEGDDLQ